MNTSSQAPGHYDSIKRQRFEDSSSSARFTGDSNINIETIGNIDNLTQNVSLGLTKSQRKAQRKRERKAAEKELIDACLQQEPENVNVREIANSLGNTKALEARTSGCVIIENIPSEKKCSCDFTEKGLLKDVPKKKKYKQKCMFCNLIKRCRCEVKKAGEFVPLTNKNEKYVKDYRYLLNCNTCKMSKVEMKLTKKIEREQKNEQKEYSLRGVVTLEPEDEEEISSLLEEAKQIKCTEKASVNVERGAFIKLINHADTVKHIRNTDLKRDPSLDYKLAKELEMKETENPNSKYQRMLDLRRRLPAYEMKETLLEKIYNNQVTLVSGQTGCGKTTQVAQFILDDYIRKGIGSTCRIICTQPRRISAISVSERVASERDESIGNSTGYIIRFENKAPRRTGSMLFCTVGVLLKFMINDPFLVKVSHIIIDEIHERDTLSDFLMIILKEILPYRPDLRIILMSATLNAELFSKYFNDCPTLNIPGRTYPVKEFYLEDILEKVSFTNTKPKKPLPTNIGKRKKKIGKAKGELDFQAYVDSIESIYSSETIDHLRTIDFTVISYELVLAVVNYICNTTKEGAILIFLPGWADISRMMDVFKDKYGNFNKFIITAIHSKLPSVSQKEIFNPAPPGFRKIVIGTNIAEASITINDIVYVIDCGRAKEMRYNPSTNISSLETVWVSKASSKQRSGRAGRVQAGECYHLFTKHHESFFAEYQIPELLRIRLDRICLQVKILKYGKLCQFLSKAINPPPAQSCGYAIKELNQIGALDENENLTSLGYHLAHLPVAPDIGKMILTGAMLSCLDPILTIAACLESADIFACPMNMEKYVDNVRRLAAGDEKSDHIMLLNVFRNWENIKGSKHRKQHCSENYLSSTNLNLVVSMKRQYTHYLKDIGFIPSEEPKNEQSNINSNNIPLIKAVVCAGLYPKVAKVTAKPRYMKKAESVHLVSIDHSKLPLAIHRQSVNGIVNVFESQWLIYHKKMKIERTFIYDTTMISPYPLMFFGGSVRYQKQVGVDTIDVDKVIKFHCSAKTAEIIINLRQELDQMFIDKINNPEVSIMAGETNESNKQKIFQAIIGLISSEKIISKGMCAPVDPDPIEDTSSGSNVRVSGSNFENIEEEDEENPDAAQESIPSPDDRYAEENADFHNDTICTTTMHALPEPQKAVISSTTTLENTAGREFRSDQYRGHRGTYENTQDTRDTSDRNNQSDQYRAHGETYGNTQDTRDMCNRNNQSDQYRAHGETYGNTQDTRDTSSINNQSDQYRAHGETYGNTQDTRDTSNRNNQSDQYCAHRETYGNTQDTRNITNRSIQSDQYVYHRETYGNTSDARNTPSRNNQPDQYRAHRETYENTQDTRDTPNGSNQSDQYRDYRETYVNTQDTRNTNRNVQSGQYRNYRETYENTQDTRDTSNGTNQSDQYRDYRETYVNNQDTRNTNRNIQSGQYHNYRETYENTQDTRDTANGNNHLINIVITEKHM